MENPHKLLILSNCLWIKTGLSRNLKAIIKELYPTGKYEIIHLCSGVAENDPKLNMFPWKSEGALKVDQASQQRYSQDPHFARLASYGMDRLEDVVKKYQPRTVLILDDSWGMPPDKVALRECFRNVNLIQAVTLDSIPIIPDAITQAANGHFFSWAKFGEDEVRKELKKQGKESNYMLGTIQGAVDSNCYKPISKLEKMELRRKFNIPQDAVVFNFVGRNQLRKKFDTLIKALASYKKQYGGENVFINIHTSWTEGWPLKRMIEAVGLPMESVLTTHVCKNCKEFEIKPYNGEGQNCKFCGAKGSQDTASITNGVADEDMKNIYGIADAAISVYTSGGLEFHCCESLFCGLPLATISYSCGSEYTESNAVFTINHIESGECNSGFIKAEPSVSDCVKFMKKIVDMDDNKRRELGRKGREFALKKFDAPVIAKKWMEVLDQMPEVDYSKVKFEDNKFPNPSFQPNFSLDGETFIKHLYSGYLDAHHPDEGGLNHWLTRLNQNQEPKEQIASIFQQIAQQDSQKGKQADIRDLLLKNDKKNLFFVVKESLGDTILSLSLLEGARLSYPNHNINVVTDPKFFDVFKGCVFLDNLIPYSPMLENEMAVIGAGSDNGIGDVFVMPTVATQKHLNYLSNNSPEMLVEPNIEIDWTLQTK